VGPCSQHFLLRRGDLHSALAVHGSASEICTCKSDAFPSAAMHSMSAEKKVSRYVWETGGSELACNAVANGYSPSVNIDKALGSRSPQMHHPNTSGPGPVANENPSKISKRPPTIPHDRLASTSERGARRGLPPLISKR
jgi:hypothetical protein